jgi:hypothetical protein
LRGRVYSLLMANGPDESRGRTRAFAALAAGLLVLMLTVSRDFGATWDEPQQHAKAHALVDYLAGRTPTLNVPIDGAHLYGAPLGVLAVLLEPVVPADPYVIRHTLIAVTGWLGLVLCGLLADRLFGPPHGLLSLVLLAVCPRYMADAMNNPKDLPFATVATAVLLALTYVTDRPPFVSGRLATLLAVVVGIGLNVRAGALLLLGYAGVVLLYRLLSAQPPLTESAKAVLRLGAAGLGSLLLGWVAWPWAYAHPLSAPFTALQELGHFGWAGTVLFDGREYAGTSLPGDYVVRWLWLTSPPVLLIGLGLSLVRTRDTADRDRVVALLGTVLFPLVYVIGTRATLYDGIRHLLFVLPPVAVLASAGWIGALRLPRSAGRLAVAAALASGMAEPVIFQVRNHPNETAYIQPLAGGPRRAYARYDLDYWGNCMLPALADVNRLAPPGPVYVSGWPLIILQADIPRFSRLVLAAPDDPRDAFFVQLARGSPDMLRKLETAPDIAARISTADGALLCAVRATGTAPVPPRLSSSP